MTQDRDDSRSKRSSAEAEGAEGLEARCRVPSTPRRDVVRVGIVLLAAQGRSTRLIAEADTSFAAAIYLVAG